MFLNSYTFHTFCATLSLFSEIDIHSYDPIITFLYVLPAILRFYYTVIHSYTLHTTLPLKRQNVIRSYTLLLCFYTFRMPFDRFYYKIIRSYTFGAAPRLNHLNTCIYNILYTYIYIYIYIFSYVPIRSMRNLCWKSTTLQRGGPLHHTPLLEA